MSHLEQNLDRLVCDARLREALLCCRPVCARIEDEGGRSVLRASGVAMHAARDPVAEADAFAAQAQLHEAHYVLLFGIGMGHALEALRHRTDAELLVHEPDLEVLRLCLEARPLAVQGAQLLRDAVAVRARLRDATRRRGKVLLLGWPPAVRRHREAFAEIALHVREAMTAATVGENTWDTRMSGWIENVLINLPVALAHPLLETMEGALRGAPAFLLAAGPSLERNIAQLKHLDGRGVILTVNTAVPALDHHGVRPDLVACLESIDMSSHLRDSPGFRGAHFVVDLPSNPAHFALAPRAMLPFSDLVAYYALWLRDIGAATPLNSGCCAAHAAFSAAHLVGCDPIVLVGQDAALTGGSFYSPSTPFGAMRLAGQDGDEGKVMGDDAKVRLHRGGQVSYQAGQSVVVHPVPAWGGVGTVLSTPQLDYVRIWYQENVPKLAATRVINATEGGARIPGVAEARLREVIAGLGSARVDFRDAARVAAPPSPERLASVRAGLSAAREQALVVEREARRAMVAGPGQRDDAAARLKEVSRDLLLQGYARRDVLGVVARGGDLRDLCAVLVKRAVELAGRLAACEAALESLQRRAA